MKRKTMGHFFRWVAMAWALIVFSGAGFRVLADCSSFGLPFTDLASVSGFCAAIAEAYYTGITNGTSPTAFSPNSTVTRAQAAAFATRTLDAALMRGSRRAALGQWWTTTPHYDEGGLGVTSVGNSPRLPNSDGQDVWVPNRDDSTVSRIRASDGANLGTWNVPGADAILVAMGKIFVAGYGSPGGIYMIDPSAPPDTAAQVAGPIESALSIAFDGNNIWTANLDGTVSIVTPGSTTPWSVTNVKFEFAEFFGILFDGNDIWVTDSIGGTLSRLNSEGTLLQTVTLGGSPTFPVFDGHNIWVPNGSILQVVRASDGAILKTFSSENGNQNGLNSAVEAAFDGQRILVTNEAGGLSLFNATDLSVIGNVATPGVNNPYGVCSDGINFWVTFAFSASVGRF